MSSSYKADLIRPNIYTLMPYILINLLNIINVGFLIIRAKFFFVFESYLLIIFVQCLIVCLSCSLTFLRFKVIYYH